MIRVLDHDSRGHESWDDWDLEHFGLAYNYYRDFRLPIFNFGLAYIEGLPPGLVCEKINVLPDPLDFEIEIRPP